MIEWEEDPFGKSSPGRNFPVLLDSGRIFRYNSLRMEKNLLDELMCLCAVTMAVVAPILIVTFVKFDWIGGFRNFLQTFRFLWRNRKVMKLLKRYAKWKGVEMARNSYPEWMHVFYRWGGISGGTIVLNRYSRILGVKKSEGHDYIHPKGCLEYSEAVILQDLMEKEGISSPEEFDLWLSQRGF